MNNMNHRENIGFNQTSALAELPAFPFDAIPLSTGVCVGHLGTHTGRAWKKPPAKPNRAVVYLQKASFATPCR